MKAVYRNLVGTSEHDSHHNLEELTVDLLGAFYNIMRSAGEVLTQRTQNSRLG